MKPAVILIASALAIGSSLAAVGIRAAVDTPPSLMAPVDYGQLKRALEAETRVALSGCRESAEKEVCRAQARADERVKKAQLNARYYGTVAAQGEAIAARAKASFDVARARCGSRSGEERADCLRAARSDRNRELAELRVAKS